MTCYRASVRLGFVATATACLCFIIAIATPSWIVFDKRLNNDDDYYNPNKNDDPPYLELGTSAAESALLAPPAQLGEMVSPDFDPAADAPRTGATKRCPSVPPCRSPQVTRATGCRRERERERKDASQREERERETETETEREGEPCVQHCTNPPPFVKQQSAPVPSPVAALPLAPAATVHPLPLPLQGDATRVQGTAAEKERLAVPVSGSSGPPALCQPCRASDLSSRGSLVWFYLRLEQQLSTGDHMHFRSHQVFDCRSQAFDLRSQVYLTPL